eukprot:TRINITY_DN19233_c0_g3_i2.p1 TRINITY_DN19233_c0_g3~~TRINITY_DN19233_c0_g3_i2.p1  ORF type:complete len:508 (-),score=41.81 TRINITY_DN19233_c0_g3_i2:208-1731(-)
MTFGGITGSTSIKVDEGSQQEHEEGRQYMISPANDSGNTAGGRGGVIFSALPMPHNHNGNKGQGDECWECLAGTVTAADKTQCGSSSDASTPSVSSASAATSQTQQQHLQTQQRDIVTPNSSYCSYSSAPFGGPVEAEGCVSETIASSSSFFSIPWTGRDNKKRSSSPAASNHNAQQHLYNHPNPNHIFLHCHQNHLHQHFEESNSFQPNNNAKRNTTSIPMVLRGVTRADLECLHSAVLSLYQDRIFPVVFNLKGRLRELQASSFVFSNYLLLYRNLPDSYFVNELTNPSGGIGSGSVTPSRDFYVALLLEPRWFIGWVDPNNIEDPYPEEMWAEFSTFLRDLLHRRHASEFCFSGGRYGMAQQLMKLQLQFFDGLVLGDYCHIVQLAISQRKLLAYEDSLIKPVASCVTFTNALLGIPDQKRARRNCITDIDELQQYILALLKIYTSGFNLSTLKRKIKMKFNRELCQTVFHCTKLVDLCMHPKIKEVCRIDFSNQHMRLLPLRM